MKCTNTMCSKNCWGECNKISSILNDIELGEIPEPDGCPEEDYKYKEE